MGAQSKQIVSAIIVAYHPVHDEMRQLLSNITSQVDQVIVVDNTEPQDALLSSIAINHSAHYIALHQNKGIAYAQNVGAELAIRNNSDYLLFLDQDSKPKSNLVSELLYEFECNLSKGEKIAAIGPRFEDVRSGNISNFVSIKHGFPSRNRFEGGKKSSSIFVNFLISSGSLISVVAFKSIGGNRNKYFIDHVDTEWCFRAISMGFKLLGFNKPLMVHAIGDEVVTLNFGMKVHISYHSPLRDYYMFRNTLLMLHDVKMSIVWRLFLLIRLLQYAIYFLIFAKERRLRLRCILLGIIHGLKGIGGRLDPKTYICTPIPKTKFDPS